MALEASERLSGPFLRQTELETGDQAGIINQMQPLLILMNLLLFAGLAGSTEGQQVTGQDLDKILEHANSVSGIPGEASWFA